ncbi:MAG: M23 family metallopeptidase [Lautropia sp.]
MPASWSTNGSCRERPARHSRRVEARRVLRLAARRALPASIAATVLYACAADERDRFARGLRDFGSKVSEAVAPAASAVAAAATPAAKSAASAAHAAADRMRTYLAEKDTLRQFKDAGTHAEASLLALLRTRSTATQAADDRSRAASAAVPSPASATVPSPASAVEPARTEGAAPADTAWRWPLDAGIITSKFGSRWGRRHRGIDIAAHVGEPVYAMADGEVIYADDKMRGYGNLVVLRHAGEISSLYAHNSALKVKPGQAVGRGTLIALLGSTGRSTGPHVHVEIRRGTEALDPTTVLPATTLPYAFVDATILHAHADPGLPGPHGDDGDAVDAAAPERGEPAEAALLALLGALRTTDRAAPVAPR